MIALLRNTVSRFTRAMNGLPLRKTSVFPSNDRGVEKFSTSSMRFNNGPMLQRPSLPSKLEVAHLQSLLKEAGVSSLQTTKPGHSIRHNRWAWLLAGLMASPLLISVGASLYELGWIPGSDPKHVERFREQQQASRAARHVLVNQEAVPQETSEPVTSTRTTAVSGDLLGLKNLLALERAKAAQIVLNAETALQGYAKITIDHHKNLIQAICAGGSSSSIILDDALIHSRPLTLSTGKLLQPSKAALVRVLDPFGKNQIIILAVELEERTKVRPGSRRPDWPSDCYGLHTWMFELEEDLHRQDANSASGVRMYLLSDGVLVNLGQRSGTRATIEYDVTDVPPGFPFRQLRQIESVHSPASNLKNSGALRDVDAA